MSQQTPSTVNEAPMECSWELKKVLKSQEFVHGDWDNAILSSFQRFEDKLLEQTFDDEETEDRQAGYGTTALALFIDDTKLLVANAGDSRCIMSCGRQVKILSADHKATNISASEANRITAAGGNIDSNLINAKSMVSRILGSSHWKQGENKGVIISEPELNQISLTEDIDFIVLASDNLWTKLSIETIVSTIHGNLAQGTSYACEALCNHILNKETGSAIFDVVIIIVEVKKPLPIYPANKKPKSISSEEDVSIVPRYILPGIEYEIKRGNLEEKYVFCRSRNKQDMHIRITAATVTSNPAEPKFNLIPERGGEFVKGVKQLCMPVGKAYVSRNTVDNKKGLRLQATVETYKELAEDDAVMNLRTLLYRHKNLFGSMANVHSIIKAACLMLLCTRTSLRLYPKSKGQVSGQIVLHIQREGRDPCRVDCETELVEGQQIPTEVEAIYDITPKPNATKIKFILVVEESPAFKALHNAGIEKRLGCVLVTGSGMPDEATRVLIPKLAYKLNVPVYGLMDPNPGGFEIFLTYKYGSSNHSHDNLGLALPNLMFIGVLPQHIVDNYPTECLEDLTLDDYAKIEHMLRRKWVREDENISAYLNELRHFGVKSQIEGLECVEGRNKKTAILEYIENALKLMQQGGAGVIPEDHA